MRKRNNRLHEYQTVGKKVLCGKFAERLTTNFAVGDEDNNLLLYNIQDEKPITVLNSGVSNVSAVTALTFTQSDDQVIVGSNRGSMNVWDLNTLKIGYCLKGHTIEICSFYADRNNENIIASGSVQTNAKLWDLRAKNCTHTVKNHNKKVSALCMSPDSRILLTGGEDGMVYSLDIRMFRPIFQYEPSSPVLSLDCNARGLVAVGCLDRVARLYELNPGFNFIGKTRNDTMPIVSCVFHEDEYLLTAGTENLKAWNVSKGQILLTDNIESGSKGILQTSVSDKIQQIAYSSGTLSYHECFLEDVNFLGQHTYSPQNNSIFGISPNLMAQKGNEDYNKTGPSPYTNLNNYVSNAKSRHLIEKRNQSMARELAGIHGNINDALTHVQFANNAYNERKYQIGELMGLMGDEHNKFLKVMGARAKSIQIVLDFWSKGNVKQIINIFQKIDIYAASDVLTQILKPSHIQISTEFGIVIAEKAKQMIKSKHNTLIKNGLQCMLQIVSLYKDEMFRLKTFGVDKGVDLARQQRIRRLDRLIEQYVQIYQCQRLKKLAQKHDETSNLATQLITEFTHIFKKVFGNQYNF